MTPKTATKPRPIPPLEHCRIDLDERHLPVLGQLPRKNRRLFKVAAATALLATSSHTSEAGVRALNQELLRHIRRLAEYCPLFDSEGNELSFRESKTRWEMAVRLEATV